MERISPFDVSVNCGRSSFFISPLFTTQEGSVEVDVIGQTWTVQEDRSEGENESQSSIDERTRFTRRNRCIYGSPAEKAEGFLAVAEEMLASQG